MLDTMLTTLLVMMRVLKTEEVGEGERVQGGYGSHCALMFSDPIPPSGTHLESAHSS